MSLSFYKKPFNPLSICSLVLTTSILQACGGGGGGSGGSGGDNTPSDETPPINAEQQPRNNIADTTLGQLLFSSVDAQAEICPNGGVIIDLGIDSNANGLLDADEVDPSRQAVVCHGTNGSNGMDGQQGENGTDGQDGQNGLNSLVDINDATIEECSFGGKVVSVGLDNNSNNVLEASEVSQQEAFCQLPNSASYQTLMSTLAETAGTNCAEGGSQIQVGLDLNNNGSLDANEVQNSSYVCNGEAGKNGSAFANLDQLIIEVVDEEPGANCLHGGKKYQIGEDQDNNAALSNSEVISEDFACNPNRAPEVYIYNSGFVIAGQSVQIGINTYDEEYYDDGYFVDEVALTVLSKPNWLSIESSENGHLVLSGTAPNTPNASFEIEVSGSDGELSTIEQVSIDILSGISISAVAPSITEGDSGSQQYQFEVNLSQAAEQELILDYELLAINSLPSISWSADETEGELTFAVGEVQKLITFTVYGDEHNELIEGLGLRLASRDHNFSDYTGTELIQFSNSQALAWFENDDEEVYEVYQGQQTRVDVYAKLDGLYSYACCDMDSYDIHGPSLYLSDELEDINLQTEYFSDSLTLPSYQISGRSYTLEINTNEPIGTEIEVKIYAYSDFSQRIERSLNVVVIPPAPDSDNDGVVDHLDPAPNNPSYSQDYDNDGMPDEWELEIWQSDECRLSYYYDESHLCRHYSNTPQFDQFGDFDNDGTNDYEEYLVGTNPSIPEFYIANEDIVTVAQGESVTFLPADNDQSQPETVSISFEELPESGSLQDNGDGSFTYTASNDRLGWIRLSYTADNGIKSGTAALFINITAESKPQLVDMVFGTGYSSLVGALFDNGDFYQWGEQTEDELTYPSNEPTLTGISKISPAGLITAEGDVYVDMNSPTELVELKGAVDIESYEYGDTIAYILMPNGTVFEYEDSCCSSETLTQTPLSNIDQIEYGIALDNNGLVWDMNGQQISKLADIDSIHASSGEYHYDSYYSYFAIDASGNLFAWGDNEYGQLGDGTRIDRDVPVPIDVDGKAVESVAAGYWHTLITTESGELYGMGYLNCHGLYLCHTFTPRLLTSFIEEAGITQLQAIYSGYEVSFVADSNGNLYGVGQNSNGQLGNGTTVDFDDFTLVQWLEDAPLSELGKEGFEWGRLPPLWRNTLDRWELIMDDVSSGDYAMKVVDQLNDYENASLAMQTTTGAGNVSFRFKTSTEADYDELIFYIDGIEQARYSGENDWARSVNFPVTAGSHSFEWVYQKDGGSSAGSDTVWLDDIFIPVDTDEDGVVDSLDTAPYNPSIQ